MSKHDSQILKGVAILMMIFMHLFSRPVNMDLCTSYLYVGHTPLAMWLSFAFNPVNIFLVLSGVGMYHIYRRGRDDNRVGRVVKLFSHYWVSLLLFTGIGCLALGRVYYDDLYSVLANYTGFDCSWNAEIWFLFPYVFVMLLSPLIFRLTDRKSVMMNVAVFGSMFFVTSFIISRYGPSHLYTNMLLYNPLLVVHLLPGFVFGSLICRSRVVERLRARTEAVKRRRLLPLVVFCVLVPLMVVAMCTTRVSVVYPFTSAVFIVLFASTPRLQVVDSVLAYLGRHSMNMWFSHSWFCYYLFHDQVYSLRYPLVIFVAVLLLSLLSSVLIVHATRLATSAGKMAFSLFSGSGLRARN